MNTISHLFTLTFLLIVTDMHADTQWIPIEPMNTNTNMQHAVTQPDINISQIYPLKQWVENAKVIKQLLDTTPSAKKSSIENDKNWYHLDNTQNNE